jgi:hypothetical protein
MTEKCANGTYFLLFRHMRREKRVAKGYWRDLEAYIYFNYKIN